MRVGIVVTLYNINVFNPDQPNPGIGGTQYMSLVLASLLATRFSVAIYSDFYVEVEGIKCYPIHSLAELYEHDLLIFSISDYSDVIGKCRARMVGWAHNTNDPKLDLVTPRAEQIVVISGAQYDLLRWHRGSAKMRVIPYPFSPSMFSYCSTAQDYIVFLGALVFAKGFHWYANAIPKFLAGRSTKLFVVGGTQTYGRAGTGRMGVTTEKYENLFWNAVSPYVSRGQVEFLGNLGHERFNILRNAKLGLTNPTGSSETFCISNFELMALGVPVMGGFHKGMTETLYRDEKLLLYSAKEIPRKVNAILDDPDHLRRLRPIVRTFVEEKSDVAAVLEKWIRVIEGKRAPQQPLSRPYLDGPKLPIYMMSRAGVRLSFSQQALAGKLLRRANYIARSFNET